MAELSGSRRVFLWWLVYVVGVVGVAGEALTGFLIGEWMSYPRANPGDVDNWAIVLVRLPLVPPLLAVLVPLGMLTGGLIAVIFSAFCVQWVTGKRIDTLG